MFLYLGFILSKLPEENNKNNFLINLKENIYSESYNLKYLFIVSNNFY